MCYYEGIMGYSGLLWVIPRYYRLFRVIMGFCHTAENNKMLSNNHLNMSTTVKNRQHE